MNIVLEDTKAVVLEMKKTLDKTGVANQFEALCVSAKQSFYNSSPFRLRDLTARGENALEQLPLLEMTAQSE